MFLKINVLKKKIQNSDLGSVKIKQNSHTEII